MTDTLVIIPTLNRPQMCARALDSLINQDYAAWNCVVAKNGGTELLGSYVAELGPRLNNPKVRMLVLPDKGLAYALNQACSAFLAGCDSFANLEDDDEWDPSFLRKMHNRLITRGADVAHCLQRQIPRPMQSDGGAMHPAVIQHHNWINFPMCLFRASLFEKLGGFTPAAGPATDWDWHLRAVKAGAKYHFVNEVLVTHHWHGNNWCTQDSGRSKIDALRAKGVYG